MHHHVLKIKKKKGVYTNRWFFKKIMPTGEIESGYKKIFRYAVSDSVKINWAVQTLQVYNIIYITLYYTN